MIGSHCSILGAQAPCGNTVRVSLFAAALAELNQPSRCPPKPDRVDDEV